MEAGATLIRRTAFVTGASHRPNRMLSCLALSVLSVSAAAGDAQTFPIKPIRMIVATTAGTGPDILARQIGAKLTENWGQQIVVDARPGATGLIGAEIVARSAADGYTLWMATMTQLIGTTMHKRLMMATAFAPVSLVASTPYVIAVSASLPVKSIAELIAYAKARPGQVLYGSAGPGSTPHLCMEAFKSMAGVNLLHVPYKSSTFALTDMMGGQVHVFCSAAPALQAFVKGGRVKALGVTTREPTPLAPGLPSVAETVSGFELVGWYGLLAPLGTPKEIIHKINTELGKVLQSAETRERLLALGAEARSSTPAEFGAFLRKETVRWEKVLQEANIRAE